MICPKNGLRQITVTTKHLICSIAFRRSVLTVGCGLLLILFMSFAALAGNDPPPVGHHEIPLSKDTTLVMDQKLFDKTKHKIEYYGSGSSRIPVKIDGHEYYPNDFDLPYIEIVSLYIVRQGVRYDLDTSDIYDIDPRGDYSLVCDGDICTVKVIYGDGAGVMMAEWEFGRGKAKRTKLTSDLREIYPH